MYFHARSVGILNPRATRERRNRGVRSQDSRAGVHSKHEAQVRPSPGLLSLPLPIPTHLLQPLERSKVIGELHVARKRDIWTSYPIQRLMGVRYGDVLQALHLGIAQRLNLVVLELSEIRTVDTAQERPTGRRIRADSIHNDRTIVFGRARQLGGVFVGRYGKGYRGVGIDVDQYKVVFLLVGIKEGSRVLGMDGDVGSVEIPKVLFGDFDQLRVDLDDVYVTVAVFVGQIRG